MVKVIVDKTKCIGCGACINVCPQNVFEFDDDMKACGKRPEDCVGCKMCEETCPVGAITITEG